MDRHPTLDPRQCRNNEGDCGPERWHTDSLTQDPALFTEPVTRLPMADTIIETYENYLQMQHSDQADMNRVVASIASQVSATTTTYPDIGIPSNRPGPDRSQDIGIASTIPEPSAGPSSSQAQPHESASQFED